MCLWNWEAKEYRFFLCHETELEFVIFFCIFSSFKIHPEFEQASRKTEAEVVGSRSVYRDQIFGIFKTRDQHSVVPDIADHRMV